MNNEYEAGRQAFLAGISLYYCPYKVDKVQEWLDWCNGWFDEQDKHYRELKYSRV